MQFCRLIYNFCNWHTAKKHLLEDANESKNDIFLVLHNVKDGAQTKRPETKRP
jgi:hypothetical protein